MKRCTKCNVQMRDTAMFCPFCGEKQASEQEMSAAKPNDADRRVDIVVPKQEDAEKREGLKKTNNNRKVIIVSVVCIIMLGAFFKGVSYWNIHRYEEGITSIAAEITMIHKDIQERMDALNNKNQIAIGNRMHKHSKTVKELMEKNRALEENVFPFNRNQIQPVRSLLEREQAMLALIEVACLDEAKIKRGDGDKLMEQARTIDELCQSSPLNETFENVPDIEDYVSSLARIMYAQERKNDTKQSQELKRQAKSMMDACNEHQKRMETMMQAVAEERRSEDLITLAVDSYRECENLLARVDETSEFKGEFKTLLETELTFWKLSINFVGLDMLSSVEEEILIREIYEAYRDTKTKYMSIQEIYMRDRSINK